MTKEQFEYWKALPETQEIFEVLKAELKEIEEFLSNGGTIRDTADKTSISTAGYTGRIRGLKSLLMMDFEE